MEFAILCRQEKQNDFQGLFTTRWALMASGTSPKELKQHTQNYVLMGFANLYFHNFQFKQSFTIKVMLEEQSCGVSTLEILIREKSHHSFTKFNIIVKVVIILQNKLATLFGLKKLVKLEWTGLTKIEGFITMENSSEPYKGRLVDYLWALSILTIPLMVCIAVVAICLYMCLVRPGEGLLITMRWKVKVISSVYYCRVR